MLNVSAETQAAFKADATQKELSIYFPNLNLTFTNADVENESLYIEESINSEDNLTFTGCCSSTFRVRIANVSQDLRGEFFIASIVADETETVPLFGGYVNKQTLSQEDLLTEIQAYDELYGLENKDVKAWYDGLTFPITLKDFRDSFFLEIGITQEETTLANDNLELSNTIKTTTLNARDVAKWICQANGRFGIINRAGVFRYVRLSPISTVTLPLTKSDYIRAAHERYTVHTIDYVKIFDSEGNYGGYGATEDNPFCISANPIAYGLPLDTAAQNILGEVAGLAYTPIEVEARGLPYIEVGDTVSVATSTATINSYILNRTLKGIQGLYDTYTSQGDEYQPQYKENAEGTNLAQERYNRIAGDESNSAAISVESNRITAEVSRATGEESRISTLLTETADGLQVQINELYSELDGETQLYYTDEVPTLLNYPAWDFTYNIPCNDTVQISETLQFEYTEEYYRKNLRSIVYDETNNMTYRFVKSNGVYYWDEVSDTETSLILSRLTTLEATTEGIQTEVTEISADLEDNYYNINTLDTKFSQTASAITTEATARQTADTNLSTRITQTANGLSVEITNRQSADSALSASISANASAITAEVSDRTSADEALSSRITANADSITAEVRRATEEEGKKYTIQSGIEINANGIEISGSKYVKIKSGGSFSVDSGNFTIDGSGNVTVKGTVTTSNITATGGSVGGFTIDSTSIRSAALTSNADGSVGLSTANFTRTINGTSRSGLRFAVGSKFGITNTGAIYAGGATISGDIYATGGVIGNFLIGSEGYLKYNDLGHTYTVLSTPDEAKIRLGENGLTTEVRGGTTQITAYGTVYIGTSSSQSVNIKGRTVAWRQLRAVDPTEYILVED